MSNTRKLRKVNVLDFHQRTRIVLLKQSRKTTLRIYHAYHRQQAVDELERRIHG